MARGPGVTDPEPRLAAGVALRPHTRTSERQDRARTEEPGSQELRAGCFGSSPRPPLPAPRRLPTGSSDAPGRVCLSFIFASTVPSPPWPAPSSRKPRTLRPAPPPGAESPPYEAESPGVWPAPPPTLLATPAASLPR